MADNLDQIVITYTRGKNFAKQVERVKAIYEKKTGTKINPKKEPPYLLEPIIKDGSVEGVKLTYTPKPEPKKKREKVPGSGPKNDTYF